MTNIRDEIIDALTESFYKVRDSPPSVTNKPVQLQSVFPHFTTPVDVTDNDLPAVSFRYGDSRRLQGDFTQEEVNVFSVHVYPLLQALPGMDLLKSASAIEETIRLIIFDLNAYQIEYEGDYVLSASVGPIFTRPEPTAYKFMECRLDFQVAYMIDSWQF